MQNKLKPHLPKIHKEKELWTKEIPIPGIELPMKMNCKFTIELSPMYNNPKHKAI